MAIEQENRNLDDNSEIPQEKQPLNQLDKENVLPSTPKLPERFPKMTPEVAKRIRDIILNSQ
ncbi:MAG: hypothetical protein AAB546_04595 [Patescibacteria group bacterium]